jgi:hypothetical protein
MAGIINATTANTNTNQQPKVTLQPVVPNEQTTKPQNVTTAPATQTQWGVTQDQTVQGQIDKVLNQNSPLQQLAASNAMQQANKRGLINTSIAVGDAQNAVIQNALPIATQDAQTNAAAAQTNTTEANKIGLFNSELGSKDQQFNISEQNKQAAQILDIENQQKLAQLNNEASMAAKNNTSVAALYDTYQRAINGILTDPNLDTASKQAAIDMQSQLLQTGMAMYADVGSLNLSDLLNFESPQLPPAPEPEPNPKTEQRFPTPPPEPAPAPKKPNGLGGA